MKLICTLGILWPALLLGFQDPSSRPVYAILNARIITVTKAEIACGTILIRDGKIAEIGESISIPAGARLVDARGLVAFPGMVHPYTHLALTHQNSADGAGSSNPHLLAYDDFSPAAEILALLPRTGFTTLGLYPTGGTVCGQALAIKPIGLSREELVIAKSVYLRIDMEASTQAKEQLKKDYEGARRALDAKKKTAQKNGTEEKKPASETPPAEMKPDEKLVAMLQHVEGKLPAVVHLSAIGEWQHFRQVLRPFDDLKLPFTYVMPKDAYKAVDLIAELKPRVIVSPELSVLPYTRTQVNNAAELHRAGATVALVPTEDGLQHLEGFLFKVAQSVKCGLDREVALRAITVVPAQILGLEARVGSLEVGKDADILLFDADPLSATARLMKVIIDGEDAWTR